MGERHRFVLQAVLWARSASVLSRTCQNRSATNPLPPLKFFVGTRPNGGAGPDSSAPSGNLFGHGWAAAEGKDASFRAALRRGAAAASARGGRGADAPLGRRASWPAPVLAGAAPERSRRQVFVESACGMAFPEKSFLLAGPDSCLEAIGRRSLLKGPGRALAFAPPELPRPALGPGSQGSAAWGFSPLLFRPVQRRLPA